MAIIVISFLALFFVCLGSQSVFNEASKDKRRIEEVRRNAYKEARKQGRRKPKPLIISGYCIKNKTIFLDASGRWSRSKRKALVLYDRDYAKLLMGDAVKQRARIKVKSASVQFKK